MILNDEGEYMVQHHIHYLEIHGYDEIVWMTKSEHTKLHRRLRREGNCNIPQKKLARISAKAESRSPEGKKYQRKYYQENREHIILQSKARWGKDTEKRRIIRGKYLKDHAEEIAKKRREAKEKNRLWVQEYQKGYQKEYRKKNKEKIKEYQRRYYKNKKLMEGEE